MEKRNNSLDGLRAIAVLLVMGVHVGFPMLAFGWLGVDIFFVLSGFLITTLLCEEYRRAHRISLPKFWGRRFLRLMPVYWLYVGSLTAAMLLGPPENLHAYDGWTPATYILSLWAYFVNFAPFGGIWAHQHLAIHLWSLAVEEQYYFLWPGLCALILRFRRAWVVGLVLLGLILALRYGASPSDLKGRLHTRGLGIVMGSTFALMMRDRPEAVLRLFRSVSIRWLAVAVAVVAYLGMSLLGLRGKLTEDLAHQYLVPWLCLLFVFIVGMLWYGPMDRLAQILSWEPLAYVGRISYGIYVYHLIGQALVWEVLLKGTDHWNKFAKFGLRSVVYVGITIAIASVSYRVIERPFLRLKSRLR